MTETEEMEARKRAYADMILNTAKEAAARVMAAEISARRLEQELNSSKEEAAGMLLRLKQMIHAKNREAQITSLNQQRKYDELESQLNEAEGIIIDLRAELNQAEEQLYKMKNKRKPTEIQNEESSEERSIKPYEVVIPLLNLGPEFSTVGGDKQSVTCNSESDVYSGEGNPILDQIKEPERFRSGCTQRIVATETSLVHESSPVGQKSNPSKNSTDTETVNAVASNYVLEEKDQQVKNDAISIVRKSHRKRKLEFWDEVITVCGKQGSYQFKKPRKAFPCLSCFSTSRVKRCVGYGEDRGKDGTKIESLNHAEVSKELVLTEAPPENMELIDVLVKPDELAAKFELNSSSRIDCDVEDGTATKASNRRYVDGMKHCKYIFTRKWKKKKSMIYNRKLKKKSLIYLEKRS